MGCSSSGGPAGGPGDGSADGGAPDVAGPDAAGALIVTGTVKDKAGVPVGSAKVAVGAVSAFSDTMGSYSLPLPAGGAVTLSVTRNWFKTLEESVTLPATGTASHDLTLEEIPLKLDPADATLAESYNKTFDWAKQPLSISIASKPTRRDFDNAVFFKNPALYKDTSKEPPLTPAPPLTIAGGTASNFTFKLTSGKNTGQEALELSSIVDAITDTPLGPTAPAEFMVWTPMLTWLGETDPAKAADLRAAGVAVRQQTWGSTTSRPQEIERVYLDASGAIWVEVVFASFMQVGPGITDNDSDGRKEIYAKVAAIHYTSDVVDKLRMDYAKKTFTTHGLSKEVSKSLNELYSTATQAQVERYIGQPFEAAGIGTINYPFVVLKHAGGQRNVILVAP
jgi:hypothetical protein